MNNNLKYALFLLIIFIHSNLLPDNETRISGGVKGSLRLLRQSSPTFGLLGDTGYSLFVNSNDYRLTYIFINAQTAFPFIYSAPNHNLVSYQLLYGKAVVSKSFIGILTNIPIEERIIGSIGLGKNINRYSVAKKQSYYSIPFQIEFEKTFWSRVGVSMTLFANIGKTNIYGLSFDTFLKTK